MVYLVTCETCEGEGKGCVQYIGETGRMVDERALQGVDLNSCSEYEVSAIVAHCVNVHGSQPNIKKMGDKNPRC